MKKRIGHALIATTNLLRRSSLRETTEEKQSLTAMQSFFLRTVYMNNKMGKETYQKDLEAEFSVRRSTASGILSIMEENGLIERVISDRDARLKTLVLTEKSLAICRKREKKIEEIEEQLGKGITPEELDMFFDIISRIRKNIDENDHWGERCL